MREPRRLAGVLVAVWLSSSCAPAPPPAPPDTRAQDEAAIKAADAAVGAAANARDAGKVASFYTDDVTLMPPNAPIVTGRENVKAFLAAMLTPADFSLSAVPTKVEVARSGDIGYLMGTYHVMFTAADGKMVMDDGKYATVWKKQADGSWKLAVDMFNSNMPLPETGKK